MTPGPLVRDVRLTRTPHLVGLVAEAERLATVLDTAPVDPPLVDVVQAEAAVASLRLDGSPISGVPDVLPEVHELHGDGAPTSRTATWLDALRAGEAANGSLAAVEYVGVRAGLGSDDLVDALTDDLDEALAELHRRLTRGLVATEHAGQPRRSRQAVHDASVGKVVYHAVEPDRIASRLALLEAWLRSDGAREHGLIASGVLHHELLDIHPFESANGRLARTAARLLLRGRGLDPHGSAAAEVPLLDDPLGYYREVPATNHRRDLTPWLERWGEAVAAGLRSSARRAGVLDADVPVEAADFLDRWPDRGFTIADFRAGVPAGPAEARTMLEALLDAGLVRRVLGSRGLRFELAPAPPPT